VFPGSSGSPTVGVGSWGGIVIVCRSELVEAVLVVVVVVVDEVSSLQPQNRPGVAHVVVSVELADVDVDVDFDVVVELRVLVVDVVVDVTVVVLSLHPNQPGVLHVVVDDDVVDTASEVVVIGLVAVLVAVPVVMVDSSRQPHQPGDLHVSVRVRVFVEVRDRELVVVSVPLLSYIFQLAQSRHSGVALHSGTVSYFIKTSWMTTRIL